MEPMVAAAMPDCGKGMEEYVQYGNILAYLRFEANIEGR
jgi:hypothetical protein